VKKIRKAPVRSTVTKVKTTKKPVVKRKVTSKK
jgi:hypothetical protein